MQQNAMLQRMGKEKIKKRNTKQLQQKGRRKRDRERERQKQEKGERLKRGERGEAETVCGTVFIK